MKNDSGCKGAHLEKLGKIGDGPIAKSLEIGNGFGFQIELFEMGMSMF